jgi:hypothetical protein
MHMSVFRYYVNQFYLFFYTHNMSYINMCMFMYGINTGRVRDKEHFHFCQLTILKCKLKILEHACCHGYRLKLQSHIDITNLDSSTCFTHQSQIDIWSLYMLHTSNHTLILLILILVHTSHIQSQIDIANFDPSTCFTCTLSNTCINS